MAMSRALRKIFPGRGFSSEAAQSLRPAEAHSDDGWLRWKRLTFFAAFPAILLGNINAFMPKEGHDPHARPEFIPYEYLRLRSKKFPWGDGNHSLFHNSHVNALPDGYEDTDH